MPASEKTQVNDKELQAILELLDEGLTEATESLKEADEHRERAKRALARAVNRSSGR